MRKEQALNIEQIEDIAEWAMIKIMTPTVRIWGAPLDEKEKGRIVALRGFGLTCGQIACKVGCSERAVKRTLNKTSGQALLPEGLFAKAKRSLFGGIR